jgi:hypothetical protein
VEDEGVDPQAGMVGASSEDPRGSAGSSGSGGSTQDFKASDQSDVDSSSPGPVEVGIHPGIVGLIGLTGLFLVSIFIIARRSRREVAAHQ